MDEPTTRHWLILASLMVGNAAMFLDGMMVNIALPSIQQDLDASFGEARFMLVGNALAAAAFLIIGGRLGDLYGRRQLLLVGLVGFSASSLLGGIASNPLTVIASRVLVGISSALAGPQVLAIIQVTFGPAGRGRAFAVNNVIAGCAVIVAQLIGGWLITANFLGLGWRSVFLLNVPLGTLAILMALALVPEHKSPRAESILNLDLVGASLAAAAVVLLVLPLTYGQSVGWPTWMLGCLLGSMPMFGFFTWYEQGRSMRGIATLVPLGILRQPTFVIGLLIQGLFDFCISGWFLVMAYYLQAGLGLSAIESGFILMAGPAAFILAASASPRLARTLGNRILAVGNGVALLGFVLVIVVLPLGTSGQLPYHLLPPLIVLGLGHGIMLPPLIRIALSQIVSAEVGGASGLYPTVSRVAGAAGVAVLGLVFQWTLGAEGGGSSYTSASVAAVSAMAALTLGAVCLALLMPRDQAILPSGVRLASAVP